MAGLGELLDVLGVLGGGHEDGHVGDGVVESGVLGQSSDLAGDALDALLRFNNSLRKKFKYKM